MIARSVRGAPKDPKVYSRRNMLHCKAMGALANASAALKKLRSQKRPPKWMDDCLVGIILRMKPVADEMARHRDEAW